MTKESYQTDQCPNPHLPNEKTAEAIRELEKGLGNKADSVAELLEKHRVSKTKDYRDGEHNP